MKKTVADYGAHVESIKKLTKDTYGDELVAFCYSEILPEISRGLLLLHLMNPSKALPDMEMVMFSLAKELSKVPADKRMKHLDTPKVLFRILDEALELTQNAGFGDIEL